ncbi:MAG: DUF2207 domain-containing protein, partial [Bacteroidales bacterium]|nr:DUF2207 domain-containing protein [Bacteroidales bacterium]
GFNFMFVTPTDSHPQDVLLTIRKEGTILTSENTSLWGFRFKGQADMLEGAARYWSTEPFGSKSAVVAMVAFEKGIFNPSVSKDGSFEDVKQKAFEGSDYKDTDKADRFFANLLAFMTTLFFFLPVIIGIVRTIRNKRRKKELLGGGVNDVDWFRGVPVDGDLRKASNILKAFSEKQVTENQNLTAAYMTRLLFRGALSIVPQSADDASFKIVGTGVPEGDDKDSRLERELFNFFKEAAGNDAILQKKELKRWADRNSSRLYSWQQKIADTHTTLKTITPTEAREVFGLKKFLKDFTLIKDRGAVEVTLWNNYLIFASLYGIADQVYKDFKKVCPEYFDLSKPMAELQNASPVIFYNTIGDSSRYFNNSAVNYASRHASGGTRWSGGGGMTSFGGGGGFSGGGFSGGR